MGQTRSLLGRMSRMFGAEGKGSVEDASSPAVSGELELRVDPDREPWWRRGRARRLQSRAAALRMVEVASALEEHFKLQDERAAAVANSLDRVGNVLEGLSAAQSSQSEYLKAIAEQVESTSKHTAGLADVVGRVPESLLSQAEAIRTVARQLEIAQESDTQLMHSLQQFGRAVDALSTSGTGQVEVLERLNAVQSEQQEALAALVRQQGKRFTIVMAIVVVLVGVVVTVVLARGLLG